MRQVVEEAQCGEQNYAKRHQQRAINDLPHFPLACALWGRIRFAPLQLLLPAAFAIKNQYQSPDNRGKSEKHPKTDGRNQNQFSVLLPFDDGVRGRFRANLATIPKPKSVALNASAVWQVLGKYCMTSELSYYEPIGG